MGVTLVYLFLDANGGWNLTTSSKIYRCLSWKSKAVKKKKKRVTKHAARFSHSRNMKRRKTIKRSF
jgi:hypothetical protein